MARPVTLAGIIDAITALPPLERARLLGELVSHDTGRMFGALRRAAIYEETRTRSYADVAGDLGVSDAAINKAVYEHNRASAAHCDVAATG